MSVFGKLFDPSGGKGSDESGKGERYDPDAGRAEVDLDAGVLILPDYAAEAASATGGQPADERAPGEQAPDQRSADEEHPSRDG